MPWSVIVFYKLLLFSDLKQLMQNGHIFWAYFIDEGFLAEQTGLVHVYEKTIILCLSQQFLIFIFVWNFLRPKDITTHSDSGSFDMRTELSLVLKCICHDSSEALKIIQIKSPLKLIAIFNWWILVKITQVDH